MSVNEYQAVHRWLNETFAKTGVCEECGREPGLDRLGRLLTDWSYVGTDERRFSWDRDDYRELCRRCHMRRDVKPHDPEQARRSARRRMVNFLARRAEKPPR